MSNADVRATRVAWARIVRPGDGTAPRDVGVAWIDGRVQPCSFTRVYEGRAESGEAANASAQ